MSEEIERIDRLIAKVGPFTDAAERARQEADRAEAREEESSSRIRAWVVAANAGAMLICFNSMLSKDVCDWAAFRPLVSLFAIGVAAIFLSVVSYRRYHSRSRVALHRARGIATRAAGHSEAFAKLKRHLEKGEEKEARDIYDKIEKAVDKLGAESDHLKVPSFWRRASGVFEFVGIAAFAGALIWAVSDGRFVAALCEAAPS